MKIPHLFFVLIIGLTSCGDRKKNIEKTKSTDSIFVETNTLSISYPFSNAIVSFIDKFDSTKHLPLVLDSAFVSNYNDELYLDAKKIKLLTTNLKLHSSCEYIDYDLKTFLRIDSLKAKKAYDAYVETLDIGMTKVSDCYAGQIIKLDSIHHILIWTLNYSTYEACPYGYGTFTFGTLILRGEIAECMLMAEMSGGGDPPVAGSDDIYSELKENNVLLMNRIQINDEDMDQPKVEVIKSHYEFKIEEGKFIQVKEQLEKAKMVKRETVGF